jgi:hypothetical protein
MIAPGLGDEMVVLTDIGIGTNQVGYPSVTLIAPGIAGGNE